MEKQKQNQNINKNKKNVIFLGWTSFFTDISSEMIFPVLPIFLKNILNAPFFLIGLIDGVAEFVSAILKYLSGIISDAIQKRKLLAAIGYGLSALSKFFFFLAGSWVFVLVLRIMDRVGKGIRTTPRDALISESVSDKEKGRYFGLHRAMDSAGAFFGVILNILILYLLQTKFSWDLETAVRGIFLVSFIPALIGVILLLIFVKDVKSDKNSEIVKNKKSYRFLFNLKGFSRNYYLAIITLGILSLGNISYSFFILKGEDIVGAVFILPIFYLIYNLFYALTSYPAGKFSDKLGRIKTLIFGFFILFIALISAAFVDNAWLIWGVFILFGTSVGITDSVTKAFISDLIKKERGGEAFGLYYGVSGVCSLIGNFLVGFLWDKVDSFIAFLVPAGFILIGILMLAIFFKSHQFTPQTYGPESFKGYR